MCSHSVVLDFRVEKEPMSHEAHACRMSIKFDAGVCWKKQGLCPAVCCEHASHWSSLTQPCLRFVSCCAAHRHNKKGSSRNVIKKIKFQREDTATEFEDVPAALVSDKAKEEHHKSNEGNKEKSNWFALVLHVSRFASAHKGNKGGTTWRASSQLIVPTKGHTKKKPQATTLLPGRLHELIQALDEDYEAPPKCEFTGLDNQFAT